MLNPSSLLQVWDERNILKQQQKSSAIPQYLSDTKGIKIMEFATEPPANSILILMFGLLVIVKLEI